LKSDFVANVSHELKTPLSLVRMFGEILLADRVPSDEKRRQYLPSERCAEPHFFLAHRNDIAESAPCCAIVRPLVRRPEA